MRTNRGVLSQLSHLGLALGLCITVSAWSAEPAPTALDTWLSGLRSLRAQFTQTIKDTHGHQTDQASGELLVLRPGRFRWESRDDPSAGAAGSSGAAASADSGQVLIADGRNVWFYDLRDPDHAAVRRR
jgi:outer membrane lipoprotein carrier protein